MPQVVIKNLTREDTARLAPAIARAVSERSEEHTSELQSH